MIGSDIGKFNPVKTGTYTMTLSGENASVDLKVTVIKPVEYITPVGRVKEIKMYIGDNLLSILPSGYKVMPEDATDRSVHYEVCQVTTRIRNLSIMKYLRTMVLREFSPVSQVELALQLYLIRIRKPLAHTK